MYDIPYISEVETIGDLIAAVESSLKYWLDCHTDPEAWCNEFNLEQDWKHTLENYPEWSNDYFTFDLRGAVLQTWCKGNAWLFVQCEDCGMIGESGYEDCNCDSPEWGEVDPDDLLQWFKEIEITPMGITENDIESAAMEIGFPIYRRALAYLVDPVISEVEDALESIENANTPEAILEALTWALHLQHVNGNIMADWGNRIGIDYRLVDQLQQEGLESYFGLETIAEFLAGDTVLNQQERV